MKFIVLSILVATVLSKSQRLSLEVIHRRLLKDGFVRFPGLLDADTAKRVGIDVVSSTLVEAAACMTCDHGGDITDKICFGCERTKESRGLKSFLRARRLAQMSPQLRNLVQSPFLAKWAAQAMNVSRVRLYQATAFVKEAGDAPSGWHQDAAACPLHTDRMVTLWIALDDVEEDAGPLVFVKASHLPGVPIPSLRDLSLVQRLASMDRWSDIDVVRLTGLNLTRPRSMRAGDATLHLGWTLHSAPPNKSGKARPAIAITYFADGARVHRDLLRVDDGSPNAALHADGQLTRASEGIKLSPASGPPLLVRLLSDDASTWIMWLHARPSVLVPGQPVQHDELTPLLYDEKWNIKEYLDY